MNTQDVRKMGGEAAKKLVEHLGQNGVVIVLMGKFDSDGPGITTAMSGDIIRAFTVLELGGDIMSHDLRKVLNLDHIPRR